MDFLSSLRGLRNRTVLVIGALVFAALPVGSAAGQQNLLPNPNFEDGHYLYNNQSSLAVPNNWTLWFAPPEMDKLGGQDDPWGQPETVVWYGGNDAVPDSDKNEFFRNGDYTLKIFGAWRPVWSTFYTDVSGLTPGVNYTLTVPIYPDLISGYQSNGQKIFADEDAGQHRLRVEIPNTGVVVHDSDWFNLKPGEWHERSMTFTASQSTMRIAFEMRGKWGLSNNGWFVDEVSLLQTNSAASVQPTAVPPTAAPAAATAQPTAVPPTPVPAQPTVASGPTAMSPAALTAQAVALAAPPTAQPTAVPPTAAPVQQVVVVPTSSINSAFNRIAPTNFPIPAPGADGKIRYTVQPDDSLVRIATLACGETLDCLEKLKALNNLSTDVIWVGQELIIGPFDGKTADENAVEAETADLSAADVQATEQAEADRVAFEATALAEANQVALDPDTGEAAANPDAPTPAPVVDAAPAATGIICVVMYEDDNANGLFEPEELAVTNGVLSLVQVATNAVLAEHTTTGSTEPYCFIDVPSDTYNVISAVPTGYTPTTNTEWELALAANSTADLQFGAKVATTGDATDNTDILTEGSDRNSMTALLGGLGVVFLMLAAGVVGYTLLANRSKNQDI